MSSARALVGGLPAAVRRRHRAARGPGEGAGERGTTLMELVVGMMIMTVFMTIFTSAMVMLYRSATKSESINLSSTQLNQAFINLDETVRYAAAISTPGVSPSGGTGDWYVELRTANTGSEVCTQLRVDIATGQLQRRSWPVTASVAGTPSAWRQVTAGITNGGAAAGATTQPFYLRTGSSTVNFQQLTVNLVSGSRAGTQTTSSRSAYTFTAINSSLPAPTGVCTFSGWRP